MAVVDAETVERCSKVGDVLRDVLPEPRVGRWTIAIAKLDTVAPNNDFASEIRLRRPQSEVSKGVSTSDPPIVGDGVYLRLSLLKSREVRLG